MYTRFFCRFFTLSAASWLLASAVLAQETAPPVALLKPSIIYKVKNPDDRLEMIVHTSRILTTSEKIVQIEPGNRDVLDMTTLSPNQIQITAKAMGVTQVSLWDESKKLYTISVLVVGDSRELALVLRSTFPDCALKVTPVKDAVMISGSVDKNEYIDQIIHIAEEYYPKIINGITVSGCQQVMLHVKIMEVSRTKLRRLGFDFSKITGANVVTSNPVGLLSNAFKSTPVTPPTPWSPTITSGSGGIFSFGIASGSSAFFGVLDALREDDLAKVLAEPTLTTISGHPASFRAGGSFYIIPNGQNGGAPITVTYGTELDFVPIVLGNGRVRVDVKSVISDIDPSLPAAYQPALKDRKAETGAELEAGQTLAIAGLVQSRTEATNGGLPWVSELPYLGVPFRKVKEQVNEIELVIMVTPELVEAIDSCDVPPCGPGMQTTSPSDWELYLKGHLEVPKCPPGAACGSDCGPGGDNPNGPPPDGTIGPDEPIPAPQPSNGNAQQKPHNRHSPAKPDSAASPTPAGSPDSPPGFIGPVGYDVVK
jgi:pilus assembly protein CpaC